MTDKTLPPAASQWATKGPLFEVDTNRAGKEPCGECHIQPGETCDICGADSSPPSQNLTREQQIVAMADVLEACRWFKAPETGMDGGKAAVWATRLWDAANPSPSPQPTNSGVIKQLEWESPMPQTNGCHVARCALGTYSAVNEQGWYVTLEEGPWGQHFEWSAPDMRMTFEDAKAAAQSDYESRVLTCLTPTPEPNSWPTDDVVNLVIAAREAFDCAFLPEEESRTLDKALEPFASKVRYANEPDELPAPLTRGEHELLLWLSKEDSSALGECEGGDLAHLEQMGLVAIQPIEGRHRHYSRVSVTEPGLAAIATSEGSEG